MNLWEGACMESTTELQRCALRVQRALQRALFLTSLATLITISQTSICLNAEKSCVVLLNFNL